jgi:hypothetical protein
MEYRLFGRSGLKVSALGYGCMTFGDPTNGNVRLTSRGAASLGPTESLCPSLPLSLPLSATPPLRCWLLRRSR